MANCAELWPPGGGKTRLPFTATRRSGSVRWPTKTKTKTREKTRTSTRPTRSEARSQQSKDKAKAAEKDKEKAKAKAKEKEASDAAAAAAAKEEKAKAPPRPPADPRLKFLKKFHGKFLPRGPLRDRHKVLMERWNSGEEHGGVTVEELKSLHPTGRPPARSRPRRRSASEPGP